MLLFLLGSLNVWGETEYEYQMVTSVNDISAGTYVVGALRSTSATNNFYFGKASVSSGDWEVSADYITIAESNGIRKFDATSLPTEAVEFTFTGDNTNGFTISNSTNYLYYTAASNRKLNFASIGSTYKWTVSAKSSPLISGGVVLKRKSGGSASSYTISENSTTVGAIRGYSSTTEYRAIYLFKKQEKSGSTEPTISVDPESATYGVNDVAKPLSVTATASAGDLHYQWYSNTTESTEGASIVGTDAASYIPSTTSAGTTYYYCVVTDGKGSATSGFAAIEVKAKHTVTWNNHGLTSESQVYEGEKPVFPETPTSCDATSTTFIGWATENWTGKLADLAGKTVYTSATEMPAVTGPVEYFAVFAKVAGESGWIETAIGDLGASDVFVIVGNNGSTYAMTNDKGTDSAPKASSVTIADSKISGEVVNNIKWNISGNATDGYTFYPNGNSESWLYCTSTNNGVRVGTNANKTFAIDGGYLKNSGTSRYVGIYNSQDWRCYTATSTNINNQTFNFYKYSAGSASEYMTTCAAEGTCEAPSFSPAAGTFDEARDITLKTSTPSAHIYYTLDGTDPDDGSAEYSTPIHITQNTTIKAITYADGLTKSSISEGVFNIRCAQPTFSLEEGEYTTAQNVIISAEGAEHIYYTLNGNDPVPGEEGTSEYTAAISINTTGSHTIKAIAVKSGYANSNVASATYVMDLPYANIAAFITAAPATAKSLTLNNAIITGVDGTTLYVQDETAGIMIYGLASLPDNAAPNHSISGTIKGAYKLFKNQHELVKPDKTTPIDMSGVTISAGEVARPAINE